MAQTKTIQLLRSQNLYESIQAAKTAMNGTSITEGRKDGEMLLARYNAGTTEQPKIQSLICIWHDATGIQPAGWTFIEDVSNNADSPAALKQLIKDVIAGAGLNNDGSYTAKTGDEIVQDVNSINGAVDAIINYLKGLDKTASAVDGKVVTTVSQANGLVDEAQADLTDVVMGGYSKTNDTGAIAATDTLEPAFSKVENTIAAGKVHSSDKTVNITDNSGKDLSVNIDNTTLVKNEKSGVISSALKVIKVIPSGNAGTDEVVDANLSNNVKEAYRLVYDGSTTAIGKQIDIYKDSSLLSVKLLHATDSLKPTYSNGTWTDIDSASQTEANLALCFAYQLADGTTSVEAVAVGDFLRESEFKDGLVVNSTGEVRVLVDKNSESVITEYGATAEQNVTAPVLSVSSDGVKVSNIQNAIDAAVAHASADLAVTAQGDNYITAAVDANNNKKINVTADVQSLTATAGTPGAYDANGAQTAAPTHGTLSGVAESLGDAADIATKVKTYVDGEIAIEAARSDAKNKADLKAVVEGLDGTADATSVTSGNVPTADFQVLTKVVETDGVVQAVGATNGSTSATLKKLAATGAAEDVSVAADKTSGLAAGNVQDTLEALTTATSNGLDSVSSGNAAIAVGDKSDKNQSVSLVLDASTGDNITAGTVTDMLTITNNGLAMKDTWDCGVF